MVARIAGNSIAVGAGVATVSGIEIPTTDQLGKVRPATPSVGAVEYSVPSGIGNTTADECEIKVYSVGNNIYVSGIQEMALIKIYDLTGKLVFENVVKNDVATTVNISTGMYIAKVDNETVKFVVSE